MPLTVRPSTKALLLLQRVEGVKLKAYDDFGSFAIASGHSNRSGLPPIVTPDMTITRAQADEITQQDLWAYAIQLYHIINNPKIFSWMTQTQWDALVHESINLGVSGLYKLIKEPLIKGEWSKIGDVIRHNVPLLNSSIYLGIARRREAAYRLFNNDPSYLSALDLPKDYFIGRDSALS